MASSKRTTHPSRETTVPLIGRPAQPPRKASTVRSTVVRGSVVTVRSTVCSAVIGGDITCGRLPMHHGEHRRTLTVAASKRAPKPASKRSAKTLTRTIAGVTYRLIPVRPKVAEGAE